ncbi:spermidine synthase [Nocardiopsis coralliicola]
MRGVAPEAEEPVTLARVTGVAGGDLVLRRAGGHHEIYSNGVALMDTRDGASERAMVTAALDALGPGASGARVLIGGLGVGFSARTALDDPRTGHVAVVELEPQVIAWHRGPLGPVAGHLPEDPRCTLAEADLAVWLADCAAGGTAYDVLCLDTDNGPDWTVREENARLYTAEGLGLVAAAAPGGAAAFWSASRVPAFEDLLERRFGAVTVLEVPARAGAPDVVYVVRVPH